MGHIMTSEMAGSVVRRVREDLGMSRAELSKRSGVSPRTLYSFETGEGDNIGLTHCLRILDELGLAMSIDYDGAAVLQQPKDAAPEVRPWDDLASVWQLDCEAEK